MVQTNKEENCSKKLEFSSFNPLDLSANPASFIEPFCKISDFKSGSSPDSSESGSSEGQPVISRAPFKMDKKFLEEIADKEANPELSNNSRSLIPLKY